jgi:hypothetical protein
MTVSSTRELASRYVAVWGEPDADQRRKAIENLWAEDGSHILEPPEEIRASAAALGFASTTLEAHGYDAIEARVARSYEEFVAGGEFVFRARDNAVRLNNVVKFSWEMHPTAGGELVGGALEVLVLDEDDRITADYMFPGL